jgi:CelD/BcsL family acetyltransferase involved in cellulose biosynthesis
MTARVIALAAVDDSFAAQWADLAERSLDPYPFMHPDILMPARTLHPAADGMRLLVSETASGLIGIMPFIRGHLGEGRRVRATQNRGSFIDLESVWHHPLVAADSAAEALEDMVESSRDLVDLVAFPGDGDLALALSDAVARRGWALAHREHALGAAARRDSFHDLIVTDAHGCPDVSLPHESPRARRLHHRLVRELSAFGAVRGAMESTDAQAIDRFLDLQDRGWKGDVTRGGNGYRRAGLEPWFRAVTDRLRARGALRVSSLYVGDQLVHMGVAMRISDRVFGLVDAYDEGFSTWSPGTVGRIFALKSALAEPGVVDFDPNMSVHYSQSVSARIYPDRRARERYLIGARGWKRLAMRTALVLRPPG